VIAPARRLWVVDPSVATPEDQGVAEVLAGWDGSSRLFHPAMKPGDGPGPATGYETDGVVVLGSMASVHDGAPWIGELAAWLRPLLAGEPRIPVLGICFGHQLLAHLAGAGVGFLREDRSKLAGIETTSLRSGLLGGDRTLRVVASHREVVGDVPRRYRVSASRPAVPVDGIEHESLDIFGFQFHPEAREEFAVRAGLEPSAIDERVRRDGRRLLEAFRERVAGERRS
jgi:GMP synthase-like glutamine amidotransferase